MKTRLLTTMLLTIALLQAGCVRQQPPVINVSASDSPVSRLLHYSRALLAAEPARRMAMLSSANSAYARQQTPETAARLALAYGQPGYKGYAPENGWRYAQKALHVEDDFWGPAATTFLQQFEQLCADNDAVRDRLDATQQKQQDIDAELAQLRKQLSAANAKLQALTRIESKLNP